MIKILDGILTAVNAALIIAYGVSYKMLATKQT